MKKITDFFKKVIVSVTCASLYIVCPIAIVLGRCYGFICKLVK